MDKPEKTVKTFNTKVEKLVYGGAGLGHYLGKVVFVPYSVPGDRLLVRPVEIKKTFIRAEIVRILEAGSGRVAPPCPHFGRCGGCHWQQLEYMRQVEAKRMILDETFRHRFPQSGDLPITMTACTHPFEYRSRARIQVRGCGAGAKVGFFRQGSHAVEDIESCPLFRPSLNEALGSLRQFKLKVDTDSAPQEMDIACSEEENSWATARLGSNLNQGVSPLIGPGRNEEVLLRRNIGEFRYAVTASVFFQANDFMVHELSALIQKAARGAGHGTALELFAGAGLFSLPLARQFSKVLAVDNSPSACRLCSANASAAGLAHIQTICADISEWINSDESLALPEVDLVVLDPPRTGAGVEVMERIQKWAPKIVIYVSCDPQTLARDLARLSGRNYRIDLVQGLDMFPQTYHFETVVRLVKA